MEEIAQILLDKKAVTLRPNNPFTYTSGIKSPIYCDNRILMSFPGAREHITNSYLSLIKKRKFDIVAGTATAGIPWAAWIAEKLKKPMIYIRADAKSYGKKNQIEGNLSEGQHVLIIEDLISTGKSSIAAVEAVREAGGIVTECIAIFTYQLQKAQKIFQEANCEALTITNITELADKAEALHIISNKEKALIHTWRKNPEEWP